jgi:hypothetical protein
MEQNREQRTLYREPVVGQRDVGFGDPHRPL